MIKMGVVLVEIVAIKSKCWTSSFRDLDTGKDNAYNIETSICVPFLFWKGQEATISFHWFFGPIDVITLFESDEKRISGKVCLEVNGSAVVRVENCKNLLDKKFCLLFWQHSGVPGKHQRRNIWVSYCRRHLHFQHLIVSQCSRRIVLNEATERILMTLNKLFLLGASSNLKCLKTNLDWSVCFEQVAALLQLNFY